MNITKILAIKDVLVTPAGVVIYFLTYCFYYLYNLLKDKNSHIRFFELSLLFIILNSSIPVAFPYVALLMALLYFKKTNY